MFDVGSVVRNYKVISEMKRGAQGFVFVVKNTSTCVQYVLKSLVIDESKKADFEKMILAWKVLCKSNAKNFIVPYIEHFYEGRNTIVIMEYCVKGDLESLIRKRFLENQKFTEPEVIKVVVEGMSILREMHFLNFIHRDVKSANFLIGADDHYKISDFNTSKILEGDANTYTMVGTPEFTSPEIVNSENYSFPTDVYSFGVVLYHMMVGKTPFAGPHGVVLKELMVGKYTPLTPALGYSQALIELVHTCLSLDPAHRPTAAQVLASPLVTATRVATESLEKLQQMVTEEVDARVAGVVCELLGRVKRAEEEAKVSKEGIKKLEEEVMELRKTIKEMQSDIPISVRPNLKGKYETTCTEMGVRCTFGNIVLSCRTIFLDTQITKGIVRLTVMIHYATCPECYLRVGVARPELLSECEDEFLGIVKGTCSFLMHKDKNVLESGLRGVVDHVAIPKDETPVPDGSLVTAEADISARTLSFFVGEKKVPRAISLIPTPLYFGITGCDNTAAFTVVSFCWLTAPTLSPVTCKFHALKTKF